VLAHNSLASASVPYLEPFRQGLRDLGYVEGQNIAVEYRFAEWHDERLPALAAELVQHPVDVLVTLATPATRAARQATATIPIIFMMVNDPVGQGLVASLA
jgi:putative ABC transport system substrate-binding protein